MLCKFQCSYLHIFPGGPHLVTLKSTDSIWINSKKKKKKPAAFSRFSLRKERSRSDLPVLVDLNTPSWFPKHTLASLPLRHFHFPASQPIYLGPCANIYKPSFIHTHKSYIPRLGEFYITHPKNLSILWIRILTLSGNISAISYTLDWTYFVCMKPKTGPKLTMPHLIIKVE